MNWQPTTTVASMRLSCPLAAAPTSANLVGGQGLDPSNQQQMILADEDDKTGRGGVNFPARMVSPEGGAARLPWLENGLTPNYPVLYIICSS
jgi:hypothetical protein